MTTARKTERRIKLIKDLADCIKNYRYFDDTTKRDNSERELQKAIFYELMEDIPSYLTGHYHKDEEYYKNEIHEIFRWEQNKYHSVKNFALFNTNHRPDAKLFIPDRSQTSVAIELKRGDSGSNLRSGLGQAILYSKQFDFVIYTFIDTTRNRNIRSSISGRSNPNNDDVSIERKLISELWDYHNVRFQIV